MPKFLVDENLSPKLAGYLRALGYSASAVREVGLTGSIDEEIVAWAKTHKHIVITRDIGFGYTYAVKDIAFGLVLLRSKTDEAQAFEDLLFRLHKAGQLASIITATFLVVSPSSVRRVRATKNKPKRSS
ncbi:DUF5615 family PIN-like protein [Candidatus Gottesmanbacteria bacterium]|nr:DUF5615 family PIN-like protein [Candidatus Gottesmanbacteria bacterium]